MMDNSNKQLDLFTSKYLNMGKVTGISDNIVSIVGLFNVKYGEMISVSFGTGNAVGMVLNIEEDSISAIIFSSDINIKPGQDVFRRFTLMSVPTGKNLLGRIVDPLGNVLDNSLEVDNNKDKGKRRLMDSMAPSIISRKSVNTPLETGLKVIDSMVPIGHGQRELIIGDTKTGKTSIAIDTILNQRSTDTLSIYVAIGQKRSLVARIAKVLEKHDCLKSSIIVAATASESAAMQYVAPYCACAMAEYFMHRGLRVLIIYDDLSKHAVAYRQLSLLLRRPPGREGYPGDVFYLHSRLLERAANLKQGGSITALPIIETIQGDVSAYIPTNVISITDGQIFLDTELFSRGIRPSVSPGLSVSRVGSAAQSKTIKKMAGNLKLELAQYREVEDFAKLGLSLDDATKLLIERGSRLTRILIQNRYQPIPIYQQILILFAALNGYLDTIKVNHVNSYENILFKLLKLSIFDLPLSRSLHKKFNEEIIVYLI
jgi:F-type H+-transporting ATPase subunit alpha